MILNSEFYNLNFFNYSVKFYYILQYKLDVNYVYDYG